MLKGLGFIFLKMGLFIRVGFRNLSLMGLGHFVIRIIGWNIKDISWMENHMEKVNKFIMMVNVLRVSIKMGLKKVKVFMFGKMDKFIKVSLKMGSCKEKV